MTWIVPEASITACGWMAPAGAAITVTRPVSLSPQAAGVVATIKVASSAGGMNRKMMDRKSSLDGRMESLGIFFSVEIGVNGLRPGPGQVEFQRICRGSSG